MIDSFFNLDVMARVLPAIISGMWVTTGLSILVITSGTVPTKPFTTIACVWSKRLATKN